MPHIRSWHAREHLPLMFYTVWLDLQRCSLTVSATMCLRL